MDRGKVPVPLDPDVPVQSAQTTTPRQRFGFVHQHTSHAAYYARMTSDAVLAEADAVVRRVTGRFCARWPADADDIRQEALLAVLASPEVPAPMVARNAAVDYLRRVYGRTGSAKIRGSHVATLGQLQAAEHVTGPTSADTAELADPALTWGLSGRLVMVARLLGAGWPKWQIAAACGVTPGQVSHYCAALREVAA